MSARDKYHNIVKKALIRDGWTITHDPYRIPIAMKRMEIDLGAEQTLAAEREARKIAVEVKSFTNPSIIHDFLRATGQYQGYMIVMRKKNIERTMYLAMPFYIYERLAELQFFTDILEELHIKLILFNPKSKSIESWK